MFKFSPHNLLAALSWTLALAAIATCAAADAQSIRLKWTGSVKQEQILGDYDWADLYNGIYTPTTSQTIARYNIAGSDTGSSFEYNGNLMFLFGDTISNDPGYPKLLPWGQYSDQPYADYHAHDPIAVSSTTDPDFGLRLDFLTKPDGSLLFVEPPGIDMGPDEIPNSGISLNGTIYLICNTGADIHNPDPHATDRSVLVKFDENTRKFYTGRVISRLNPKLSTNDPQQGHFIFNSLLRFQIFSGDWILMYGTGPHRASDVYLALVPTDQFETGAGTLYYTLNKHGQPDVTNVESKAYPVVFDDPLGNQQPWPNDDPTIGSVSVVFSADLGLWLMTYDGGRQNKNPETTGVYFTYAQNPWGPWKKPQMIYNATLDGGIGTFIRDPALTPPGPAGPTIGFNPHNGNKTNPPDTTRGAIYAPHMIQRFTRVKGNVLSIYYTLSTWNPYTVVLMRSDFKITSGP